MESLPKSVPIKMDRKTTRYHRIHNLKEQEAIRAQLNRQKALLNRQGQKPSLDPHFTKKKEFHDTDLSGELGPAVEDLDSSGSVEPLTLDQKMDEFLAKRQAYEELEEAKKQAYAQRFIEEARLMGFDVQINSAMEIMSVTPINPQQ